MYAQLENVDLSSLELWEMIVAAVVVVLAGFVAGWARRRIRRLMGEYENLDENVPRLLGRVAGSAVMLLGVLVALGILGFDIGFAVLALILVAGVFALTGRGILENFAAGMVLQIRAPFHVGDRIETSGFSGTVEKIDSHAVVIETDDHRTVHVPNKEVLSDPIVSYTNMPIRRSEVEVGISYKAGISATRDLLVAAAEGVAGVRDDKSPRAFVNEFADSAVKIAVQFWHDDGERIEVRNRVATAMKDALDSAGVEIPFPHLVVEIRDAIEESGAKAGEA